MTPHREVEDRGNLIKEKLKENQCKKGERERTKKKKKRGGGGNDRVCRNGPVTVR